MITDENAQKSKVIADPAFVDALYRFIFFILLCIL